MNISLSFESSRHFIFSKASLRVISLVSTVVLFVSTDPQLNSAKPKCVGSPCSTPRGLTTFTNIPASNVKYWIWREGGFGDTSVPEPNHSFCSGQRATVRQQKDAEGLCEFGNRSLNV